MNAYPLLFEPVLKDYVWGGRNLERLYGRPLPEGITAESWEIAAHEDGTTRVSNGVYAGKLLTELQAELGLDLIGTKGEWAQARGKFPLLVKLLDAQKSLSVQVHPDDAYALEHEGNELGKTEMWVVLHAEPDAAVILGVRQGTTPDLFRQAIADNRAEPFLHQIPVVAGDVVCVPAGSLHAILGGLVIAEIQQNSNTTYRVYDWGRPRPLHVDKALQVINFEQVEPVLTRPQTHPFAFGIHKATLCHNDYFITEQIDMAPNTTYTGHCDGSSLEIWGTLTGTATITGNEQSINLPAIQFTLLPAHLGTFTITVAQPTSLLRTYLP
ncbi:MAG: class I mannose-6-phosphate isomerase [Chloroflexi bacterium]|nr:class I mannose-6-phosphate isomerase [Chloroflexota bacterium]MBP8056107.1 class I mannose-6-phosphate isomerase [Chloroflexota bacterium]